MTARYRSGYADTRQRQDDLAAMDHLPECPSCGDLADPGATVCECGQRLVPRVEQITLDRAESTR